MDQRQACEIAGKIGNEVRSLVMAILEERFPSLTNEELTGVNRALGEMHAHFTSYQLLRLGVQNVPRE